MSDPIDYESLLRRYMQLILLNEGVTYLSYLGNHANEPEFSTVELEALKKLETDLSNHGR